jgi:aspartate/methionine/tyrosine aminotransferase
MAGGYEVKAEEVKADKAVEELTLPPINSMRDINDFCVSKGLPSLAQGMIELPPPRKLREIASELVLEDTVHTYRARAGEKEFLEGISGMLNNVFGEVVPPSQIQAVQGVTGGVVSSLLLLRKRNPTAKVAVLEPFYTYHLQQVRMVFQQEPVFVGCAQEGLFPDFEQLEKLARAGEVQGAIIVNPSNPSGLVLSKEQVERLEMLSKETGLFLIFDECYADMVFDGQPRISPVRNGLKEDNITVCRGFSKCVGAQSWRVGFVLASEQTVLDLMPIMDPVYICTPRDQHAVARYVSQHVDDYKEHILKVNELLRGNWTIIKAAFTKRFGWTPVEPQGTMYGMFRHNCDSDTEAAEMALRAGCGVCPGWIFMRPGTTQTHHIRIHCGVTKEKAEAIAKSLTA